MMLGVFLNLMFSFNVGITSPIPQPRLWGHLAGAWPFEAVCNADGANCLVKPPVVEWLTEREHDFQHMRQEHPKSFVFLFKNIDSAPVILQTVRTSCGCTAATWTETPIAPGETGQIEVEYDAYKQGEFRKKITVFFDRQRKPETLWIRGEVD